MLRVVTFASQAFSVSSVLISERGEQPLNGPPTSPKPLVLEGLWRLRGRSALIRPLMKALRVSISKWQKKTPSWKRRGAAAPAWAPLIFQKDHSAGIGTCLGTLRPGGCRGFTGPVPPPLWIRALPGIQLSRWHFSAGDDDTTERGDVNQGLDGGYGGRLSEAHHPSPPVSGAASDVERREGSGPAGPLGPVICRWRGSADEAASGSAHRSRGSPSSMARSCGRAIRRSLLS